MNLLEIPVMEKDEPIYKYQIKLHRYMVNYRYEKKKKILEFINEWYNTPNGLLGTKSNLERNTPNGLLGTKSNLASNSEFKFENILQFKNQYYHMMPKNDKSKEFLIKNFEKYNEEFNLELEYDEELFTTYNVLYFIKLMLKKIDGDLKKEVLEIEQDGKKKKQKKYTITLKKL
jgi:hypothetical protein